MSKPVSKPPAKSNTPATTTKAELKQIIKGLLLEMISDGTLPAAIKTYETLMEGSPRNIPQRAMQAPEQPRGFITEHQRAAMNAQAAFGSDPEMADIFADTLANADGAMLEEQARMEAIQARKQQLAPVPGYGESFPRNMLPPRDESAQGMLSENAASSIIPNAPAASRWAELAFSKSKLPTGPNKPGFLPGQR